MVGLSEKQSNVVLIVVGLIALFLIFKIFRGVGLIKSADEEKEEKQAGLLMNVDWLKPKYYTEQLQILRNKKPQTWKFKVDTYFPNIPNFQKYARQIWDSKGFWKDNESSAIGVMKSMISKSEASFFADFFQKYYKRDLATFLETFMNDKQLNIVYESLKPLRAI